MTHSLFFHQLEKKELKKISVGYFSCSKNLAKMIISNK